MNRREFIMGATAIVGASELGFAAGQTFKKSMIAKTSCQFEREPMVRPFGFKGGYLTEEWIVSAYVRSTSGLHGIGLGTQSSLWSDAKVFAENSKWRQMGCSDMRSDQFPMDVPDSSTLARCVRSRLRGRCGEFTKDMNLIKDKGNRGTDPYDTVGVIRLWRSALREVASCGRLADFASVLPSRVLGGGRGR